MKGWISDSQSWSWCKWSKMATLIFGWIEHWLIRCRNVNLEAEMFSWQLNSQKGMILFVPCWKRQFIFFAILRKQGTRKFSWSVLHLQYRSIFKVTPSPLAQINSLFYLALSFLKKNCGGKEFTWNQRMVTRSHPHSVLFNRPFQVLCQFPVIPRRQ